MLIDIQVVGIYASEKGHMLLSFHEENILQQKMKTRGSAERRRQYDRERAKFYYTTDEDKEKKKKTS